MTIIAIANQKGGVGKTTLAILLATSLADQHRRVIVVDLDPQANATTAAAVTTERGSMADVLVDARRTLAEILVTSPLGFDIAPSEVALAAKEQARRLADEHDLHHALTTVTGYDVVLVDCPPSLGVLTISALTAADAVLVVTDPSGFALDGVTQLLETIGIVRRHYNPGLRVAGVALNLHDHTLATRHARLHARRSFDGLVLEAVLPRRVGIREALTTHTRLADLPADRDGDQLARIVDRLADEVETRVR